MINWKKEIYNEANNTYALIANIEGIEAAFLNRPDFDTDVWNVRFDKDNYEGDPKILKITEEAFRWNLKFEKSGEVMNYLQYFIPYYLKTFDYDFNKIPNNDLIKSDNPERLPKLDEIINPI